LLEDGCVAEVNDPDLGPIRQVGITYRLESSPGTIKGPAPRPGAHTAEVKAEAAALKDRPAPAAQLGKSLNAPLEGITVLDLGLAIAGPYGTQLLSDLGADVIKINAPYDMYWHRCHIAYMANRGKRSISLNLKSPRGMEILKDLVRKADVVQHNMRYDAAERLGIDYESLKKLNPRLVYCHTRGFETGPRQSLPGNDQTGACLAGVQYEDGGMGRGGKPLWSLTSFGDTGNGFLAAVAILQALYHRDRTGEGQMVDTSIINACLLNSSYAVAHPDGRGVERPRVDGMQLGFSALHRLYETASGWLCLVATGEGHWKALCSVPGFAPLGEDPRFRTAAARAENDEALGQLLEEAFRWRPAADWIPALDRAGVPAEVSSTDFALKLHDDPELQARQWVTSYPHPSVGRLDQVGLLFDLSATPGRIQGPPLVVGQHSREILGELGYGTADIDALIAERIVSAWAPGEAQKLVASPWQAASEKK
jgi:crotonobetainyl-CoA:carnitine CoA-transferase CaiB-like acyl-CoA transferase